MFPPDLLDDDEDLVVDLRPHWIGLARPSIQIALITAAALSAFLFLPYRWGAWPFATVGIAALALLVRPIRRILVWGTSHFLVTTDRVMLRSGLIGRSGRAIPLDRIADVRFRQGPVQRLFGAGDIEIEPAGSAHAVVFANVPGPEIVQLLLFQGRVQRNLRLTGRG